MNFIKLMFDFNNKTILQEIGQKKNRFIRNMINICLQILENFMAEKITKK